MCALIGCTQQGEEISSGDFFSEKGDHSDLRANYEPIEWCSFVEGNLSDTNRWDGYGFHISEDEMCENVAVFGNDWEIYRLDRDNPNYLGVRNRVASYEDCRSAFPCAIGSLEVGDYMLVATTQTHVQNRGNDIQRPDVRYRVSLQCLTSRDGICHDPKNTTCDYDGRVDIRYASSIPDHPICTNLSVPTSDDAHQFRNDCGCGERCFPSATQPGVTYTDHGGDRSNCPMDTVVDVYNYTQYVDKANSCGCTTVDVDAYCHRSMDAQIDPATFCIDSVDYGWRWNDGICQHVFGCECIGEDCDELFPTREACVADGDAYCYAVDSCEPKDAQVDPAAFCTWSTSFGWKATEEDGCQEVRGCGCIGEDCGRLFASREECVTACFTLFEE